MREIADGTVTGYVSGYVNIDTKDNKETRQKAYEKRLAQAMLDDNDIVEEHEEPIEDVMKSYGFYGIAVDGKHITASLDKMDTEDIEYIFQFDCVEKASGSFYDEENKPFSIVYKDGKLDYHCYEEESLDDYSTDDLIRELYNRNVNLNAITKVYKDLGKTKTVERERQ